VSTLHALEIFHGDLSPAHMLLEETRVSLLGFGWATTRLEPHRIQGTEGYVSPEQWSRGIVTVQGVVYSLAMVLGCALTKCSPREVQRAGSFFGLWDAHSSWTIPPDLGDLLALLDRAIAPEPTARPALAVLQEAFAGEQGTI
jgi:serine/threonine protein kinase